MKVLAAVSNGSLVKELSSGGLEVVALDSIDEFDRVLDFEPSFALVDERLEFAADLMVRIKAELDGPDRDRLPIISVGGANGALRPRCVADAHVTETAGVVVDTAKAIIMRRARQRRLFDQEMDLKVPTTPECVERAGDYLDQLIESAGYAEEDGVKLGTTLREALGNAAEHGNKNDPQRTIHVNFFRSVDRVAIVITDEGPGFDTTAFLARADEVSALEHTRSRRDTEARPGGLGVFIMKQTCDGIAFNDAGNSIYLMKFLPGHTVGGS